MSPATYRIVSASFAKAGVAKAYCACMKPSKSILEKILYADFLWVLYILFCVAKQFLENYCCVLSKKVNSQQQCSCGIIPCLFFFLLLVWDRYWTYKTFFIYSIRVILQLWVNLCSIGSGLHFWVEFLLFPIYHILVCTTGWSRFFYGWN